MTLALILQDYAGATGQQNALSNVIFSDQFRQHLRALQARYVYHCATERGTHALAEDFVQHPTRYDFIITYGNVALEQVISQLNQGNSHPERTMHVVYPRPSVSAEHAVYLLGANRVHAHKVDGAKSFLTSLQSVPALANGVRHGLRPVAVGLGRPSFADTLEKYKSYGFEQSVGEQDLPPYDELNNALEVWLELLITRHPKT